MSDFRTTYRQHAAKTVLGVAVVGACCITWRSAVALDLSVTIDVPPQPAATSSIERQPWLAFIDHLHTAIEADAFPDPQRLEVLTGLKVLSWSDTGSATSRQGSSFEFTDRALSDLLTIQTADQRPSLVYGLLPAKADRPAGYIFQLRDLSRFVCITRQEWEAIFGPSKVSWAPRSANPHGGFAGPLWYAISKSSDSSGRNAITVAYQYRDGTPPVVTCVSAVTVVPIAAKP